MDARREPDYYAILQVDRHAHPLFITRVYRLLAALYHPDNKEKGDTQRFRRVMEAARVLSDPVRRAAYDRSGQAVTENGATALKDAPGPVIEDQRGQRMVLLQGLYDVRRNRPSQPDLPLMVLGELLGCSVAEAQFTLWYLRGKRLIKQTGWAITVAGVDCVEANHLGTGGRRGDLASLYPHSHALASHYPPVSHPTGE
jgi:curved DNA-binding protein CbpA